MGVTLVRPTLHTETDPLRLVGKFYATVYVYIMSAVALKNTSQLGSHLLWHAMMQFKLKWNVISCLPVYKKSCKKIIY